MSGSDKTDLIKFGLWTVCVCVWVGEGVLFT